MRTEIKLEKRADEFVTEVHADGLFSDYTLCGIALEVDKKAGIYEVRPSRDYITCNNCKRIISYCKNIEPSKQI